MRANITKTGKVRLNLEFTPRVYERLERLMEVTDAASRVEVIRRALYLYDMAVTANQRDGKLIIQSANGSQDTIFI